MKGKWFLFFFRRSISQRKGRVIIASFAITMAVSIITAMAGITTGINEKLGSELKAYGANIIASPKDEYIDYEYVHLISKIKGVEVVDGQILKNSFINKHQVEVMGIRLDRLRDKGWRIYGDLPDEERTVLVGINIKNALKIEKESIIKLSSDNKDMDFRVRGFIESGGAEDNSIIMSIEDVWKLTDTEGKINVILIRGRSEELEDVSKNIETNFPSLNLKTVRQVAFAEESLLKKIQLLMMLVTSAVLFATIISVGSTMGANVLERRLEIGLMKAIGATRNNIGIFFIAEAILTGTIGGVLGFLSGYVVSQIVSKGAFGSFISIPLYLSISSLIVGLFVSILASYFPVRDAIKYNPAVILKGE